MDTIHVMPTDTTIVSKPADPATPPPASAGTDPATPPPIPPVAPKAPAAKGTGIVAVGPEGGWSDYELRMFEAVGFRRVSLGPRVLRTDTAVVALLAQLTLPRVR